MISIQAYRAVIGAFLNKAKSLSLQESKQTKTSEFEAFCFQNNNLNMSNFLKLFGLGFVIMVIICNFNVAFLKILKLLSDGDIESNPGPSYEIVKVVQGSFNQGHPQFGVTSGMQCACNSLFSICWSTVRRVALWKNTDLDYILINGDEIFKKLGKNCWSTVRRVALWKNTDLDYILINGDEIFIKLGKNCYLAFEDLPRYVTSGNTNFAINMLVNEQGELTSNTKSTFLHSSFTRSDRGDGLLFMTSGYTFCIIWNKTNYFLFDPHSRNYNGVFTANGTSILLKFSSVTQLQNYIYEIYYPLRQSESLFYQIQYVSINTGGTCTHLLQDLKKGTERERKSYYFRNNKGTLKHDQLKP